MQTAQRPVHAASNAQPPNPSESEDDGEGSAADVLTPGYPYLNAPMYPVPRPDIPYQVGGAVITNQALSPHEMLYPHTYQAMYPPYYYKVRGGWIVTPHGVQSHETWVLKGTEVKVKYRTRRKMFSGFKPPIIR
jgi:hypothetical protein